MKKPTAGNITTIAEAREASTLAFNKKQYGDLIHAQRTHLGLSQAQLAKKLGVQKAYVTHWEAGRSRPDLNLIALTDIVVEWPIGCAFVYAGSFLISSFQHPDKGGLTGYPIELGQLIGYGG